MDNNNFINLEKLNLDTPVYRILPLNRLEELFCNKELVLVRTSLWEDPFENYFFKSTFKDSSGNHVSAKPIADSWYGQCWTLNSDTDAMWRIYSPDKQSVRIKTTLRKLSEANWDEADIFRDIKYFIGKVTYQSREKMVKKRNNTSFFEMVSTNPTAPAKTLLTKRAEFAHEQEIRVLYFESGSNELVNSKGPLHKLSVDPHDLIEEVCIDPRLEDGLDIECLIKKVKRVGYTGNIIQSDLYKFNDTPLGISYS